MHAVEQLFNADVQSFLRTKHEESLICMLYCGGCGICAADAHVTSIGTKCFVASNMVPCPINGEPSSPVPAWYLCCCQLALLYPCERLLMFMPLQQSHSSYSSSLQGFTYATGQLPSLQLVLDISDSTNVSCCLQADMPLPSPVTPLALPRQTSPLYDPKPAFSTSITATATLQSTSSNAAKVHNSSSSTLKSQHSSSSTATAAVLASLRQQHGLGMHVEPSRGAEDRQQPGQDSQATATSRRYALCHSANLRYPLTAQKVLAGAKGASECSDNLQYTRRGMV